MKRTMEDTWWSEVRWRVALQFILWGVKMAPAGEARGDLIDTYLGWVANVERPWNNGK